jgi:hypothetical protein
MQHAPILVDHRVDYGVSRAAIFRLHVENLGAHLNVGIESGAHAANSSAHTARTGSGGELTNWEFI